MILCLYCIDTVLYYIDTLSILHYTPSILGLYFTILHWYSTVLHWYFIHTIPILFYTTLMLYPYFTILYYTILILYPFYTIFRWYFTYTLWIIYISNASSWLLYWYNFLSYRRVISVETLGCPNLKKVKMYERSDCLNHTHCLRMPVCAEVNVMIIKSFLKAYFDGEMELDEVDR